MKINLPNFSMSPCFYVKEKQNKYSHLRGFARDYYLLKGDAEKVAQDMKVVIKKYNDGEV